MPENTVCFTCSVLFHSLVPQDQQFLLQRGKICSQHRQSTSAPPQSLWNLGIFRPRHNLGTCTCQWRAQLLCTLRGQSIRNCLLLWGVWKNEIGSCLDNVTWPQSEKSRTWWHGNYSTRTRTAPKNGGCWSGELSSTRLHKIRTVMGSGDCYFDRWWRKKTRSLDSFTVNS